MLMRYLGILTSSQLSSATRSTSWTRSSTELPNSRAWLRQTPRWFTGLMEWARPIRMHLRPNQAIQLAATVGVP